MYFVQILSFKRHTDVTCLVRLFGQPNSALCDMEPRLGGEIGLGILCNRCNILMHFRGFRA